MIKRILNEKFSDNLPSATSKSLLKIAQAPVIHPTAPRTRAPVNEVLFNFAGKGDWRTESATSVSQAVSNSRRLSYKLSNPTVYQALEYIQHEKKATNGDKPYQTLRLVVNGGSANTNLSFGNASTKHKIIKADDLVSRLISRKILGPGSELYLYASFLAASGPNQRELQTLADRHNITIHAWDGEQTSLQSPKGQQYTFRPKR